MAAPEQLFNVRERKRFERHDIWERITENGTISAAVMVFAAIAAVICANTDAYEAIHHFLETPLYVGLGNLTAGLTVELFVNDFLMAIFFLLVGIELKYEMTVGELKNPRQAMLPMLAAVGGVVVPACIYLIFNHAGAHNGWAIPMATDIAFALGVLSLLGNRVPNGVRVFFSTLAIADDLISIAAIAIFYGQSPNPFWLGAAALVTCALVWLNRRSITALPRTRCWACCCGSACSRAACMLRSPASSWPLPSRPSAASSSIASPIGWASACRCSMTATMTRHTSWASMTLPSRLPRSSASCTA